MSKGQTTLVIILGAIVVTMGLYFFFFRPQPTTNGDIQYKNDIVTLEKYTVTNLAPYESKEGKPGTTSIQFEIHNNGDKSIPYLELDFFDLSGFTIEKLDCGIIGQRQRDEGTGEFKNKCIYDGSTGTFSRLETTPVTITFKTPQNIDSSTPFTVSFAIRYVYFGFRDALIPVIDGVTKKEPTSPFTQSNPSFGPVALDIQPALDRTVTVGDKTVTQYWGISGDNSFPFVTRFKFSSIGTVDGKIQGANITKENVRIKLVGLEKQGTCEFDTPSGSPVIVNLPESNSEYPIPVDNSNEYNLASQKNILVSYDTLFCTFKPNLNQPEYTAVISAVFAYKYEFIRSQEFVVHPLPK